LAVTGSQLDDLAKHYAAQTDDQLLLLKQESGQLTAEAREQLAIEIGRRRIKAAAGNDLRGENVREPRRAPDKLADAFPSLRRFLATLRDWKEYKRRTGKWPMLSILFWFVHGAFLLGSAGFLVWFGVGHHWSRTKWILIVGLFLLLDVVLEDWIRGTIRLHELRHQRKARSISTRRAS
jgi:hypothetical protein